MSKMDPMLNSASSYAPSTIINVQCQNARNSTCAAFMELMSRLKSRSAILIITFVIYTILGAIIFLILEKSADENRVERLIERHDRKRYQLIYPWKKYNFSGPLLLKHRSEWINETTDRLKWYEDELSSNIKSRTLFWNFENSLFFSGASMCTTGFHFNVLKTTLGRAVFICFSTFGIFLFCFCTSRTGYFLHRNFERLLYCCQQYQTIRPQMRSLLIYIFFVPAMLAGQNGLIYYLSRCESYLDTLELHFFSVTTVGRVDLDKCLNDDIVGRLVVLICIFLWFSTIWSFVHSFERQRNLLYEYLTHWLIFQTDESLQLMSSSMLLNYNNCLSLSYADSNSRIAFIHFLRSALDENCYHLFLLKTLNRFQLYELSKLYRKICHRYSQPTQTDRLKRISRGTMTLPQIVIWYNSENLLFS